MDGQQEQNPATESPETEAESSPSPETEAESSDQKQPESVPETADAS